MYWGRARVLSPATIAIRAGFDGGLRHDSGRRGGLLPSCNGHEITGRGAPDVDVANPAGRASRPLVTASRRSSHACRRPNAFSPSESQRALRSRATSARPGSSSLFFLFDGVSSPTSGGRGCIRLTCSDHESQACWDAWTYLARGPVWRGHGRLAWHASRAWPGLSRVWAVSPYGS